MRTMWSDKPEILRKAPAKINLFLSVLAKRPDGYHEIDTVFQSTSLYDTVRLCPQQTGILLFCSDSSLPSDSRNLAYRAASAYFAEAGNTGGVQIHLTKRIPSGAGLGGGSSDAPTTLFGATTPAHNPLPNAQLFQTSISLGSDVPFFLRGGTARATGIGELLSDAPPLQDCQILIVKGAQHTDTPNAYAALDACEALPPCDAQKMLSALSQNAFAVCQALYNQFAQIAPYAKPLCDRLCALGADGAALCGSGAAVFGIFTDSAAANAAKTVFSTEGYFTALCACCDREGNEMANATQTFPFLF